MGPLTIFFNVCIEGGREIVRGLGLDFAIPDFGLVARRLFSCSSLARSNAVD